MGRNRFGFYLQEKRDGALWIDDIPADAHIGELTRHELVDPPAYWSLKLMDVKVNGKSTGVCPGGCKVAIDSGTSLLTGPSEGAGKVLDMMQLDPGCGNLDSLGDLTFVLEATDKDGKKFNKEYPLKPREFVLESQGDQNCRAGISHLDVPKPNGPVWILGDMFMMKYFSVFDRDENAVYLGLANPKANEKEKDMIKLGEESESQRSSTVFDSSQSEVGVQEQEDLWVEDSVPDTNLQEEGAKRDVHADAEDEKLAEEAAQLDIQEQQNDQDYDLEEDDEQSDDELFPDEEEETHEQEQWEYAEIP